MSFFAGKGCVACGSTVSVHVFVSGSIADKVPDTLSMYALDSLRDAAFVSSAASSRQQRRMNRHIFRFTSFLPSNEKPIFKKLTNCGDEIRFAK